MADPGRAAADPTVEIARGHDASVFTYTQSASIAREYDGYHSYSRLFRTDAAFIEDIVDPGARVLDLGCGTGRLVVRLALRGCEVTGVDLSPHMLAVAAEKLEHLGLFRDGSAPDPSAPAAGDGGTGSARLLRADICRLDGIEDGSFDAAVCMFSTMGILRGKRLRREALAEWRRVIAPGGLLVVHTHNLWHNLLYRDGRWWAFWNLVASVLPGREFGDKRMEGYCRLNYLFVHVFRLGELRRLLARAGFVVEGELLLNEARTGPVEGRFRWLRANGFIVAARKA